MSNSLGHERSAKKLEFCSQFRPPAEFEESRNNREGDGLHLSHFTDGEEFLAPERKSELGWNVKRSLMGRRPASNHQKNFHVCMKMD